MSEAASVPVSADDEVRAIVVAIAHDLDARKTEITRSMSALLAREIDQLDADPKLVELLEASVAGNVATIIHVLANDIPVDHLQPTTAAVEYALRLAQRDVPSHSLVRAYHMGQDVLLRTCHDAVTALDLPTRLSLDVVRYISDVAYRYIDWITLYVFDTYERERRRWIGAQADVHSSAIRALLAGAADDPAPFESATGYRLSRTHVAMIVWSTDDAADLRALDRCVRGLAARLGAAGPPILTAVDRQTLWAWLPFDREAPAVASAEVVATGAVPAGVRVALGMPTPGRTGFRRSHQQALAAYSVATMPGSGTRPVVGFGDRGVAVVSLLAENPDSTRAWVWEVLGPLAEDTEQAATLRATLSTYFATGESHLHTAQRMNLHRNTVKYRIAKALGDPAAGPGTHSKLDLALALQVCEYLGAKVLRPR
ncbi:PucR family transcriptional regulator [Rhodococcus olei]|uniref:PucR family transcriptional regulator n=1 Tax=Rhodococcus olei TaxID=2161675 RepID=A0ABP8P7G1_9NOCA